MGRGWEGGGNGGREVRGKWKEKRERERKKLYVHTNPLGDTYTNSWEKKSTTKAAYSRTFYSDQVSTWNSGACMEECALCGNPWRQEEHEERATRLWKHPGSWTPWHLQDANTEWGTQMWPKKGLHHLTVWLLVVKETGFWCCPGLFVSWHLFCLFSFQTLVIFNFTNWRY